MHKFNGGCLVSRLLKKEENKLLNSLMEVGCNTALYGNVRVKYENGVWRGEGEDRRVSISGGKGEVVVQVATKSDRKNEEEVKTMKFNLSGRLISFDALKRDKIATAVHVGVNEEEQQIREFFEYAGEKQYSYKGRLMGKVKGRWEYHNPSNPDEFIIIRRAGDTASVEEKHTGGQKDHEVLCNAIERKEFSLLTGRLIQYETEVFPGGYNVSFQPAEEEVKLKRFLSHPNVKVVIDAEGDVKFISPKR